MLKSLRAAALWLCVLFASAAWAIEVPALYSAEVPLDHEADDARALAYDLALVEVLTRVSGSELAADSLLVAELFPDPSAYVVQFRRGKGRDSLWVSFDGNAIEEVLRRAGQTVWGGDRPLTLIWLAVDWGRGEREILAAEDSESSSGLQRSINRNHRLRERLLDIAERRGLPVAFPLLDTEDLQKVSFSDVWGGFDQRLLEASKRYEAGSVLIGRLRPGSSQQARWSYHFAGEQRAWNGEPDVVLSRVADTLAHEFAIDGNAPVRTVQLAVAGILSVDHYGSVQDLLGDISIIEDFSVLRVEGDRIVYNVAAHGGAERLRRALRFGGLIEQRDEIGPGAMMGEEFYTPSLEFYFNP